MKHVLAYDELWVPREYGNVYARDYAGEGPAFVLMHGFPDNLHIYDDLVRFLVEAGRRVVTFDFLGFGASDKQPDAKYGFAQQLGDLEAVVAALDLESLIPVAHDSSGPVSINFTLAHPERVAWLCILNSAYDDAIPIHWPEMIDLFARKSLQPLSVAIAQAPAQFAWILGWQAARFGERLPDAQRAHFETFMGPLIADNFVKAPSSGPAFLQLASGFFEELAKNAARLPELKKLDVPVRVIWGEFDPYFTPAVAKDRVSHFKNGSLHILPGGHWVQSDVPEQVAREMLA